MNGEIKMGRKFQETEVDIQMDSLILHGNLTTPENSEQIVIFAHGSGSSRHSPRNRYVANALNKHGLTTLLFDLLTSDEEQIDIHSREFRFDISLLAQRLVGTTQWVEKNLLQQKKNIGYFGSSTGAAAALVAAAQYPDHVKSIVSRGGRPDLAGRYLSNVKAPTLLIVGEYDFTVIDLNRDAMKQMHAENELAIVPGATHLFEEPGTLDRVIEFAVNWFTKFLFSTK